MCKVLLTLLILLISVSSEAAYKVYLKNGSEIPDVSSYDEIGDDVTLYFRTGSMEISRKDILKIEGSEVVEKEKGTGEAMEGPETQGSQEVQEKSEQKTVTTPPQPQSPVIANSDRLNELKDQINSLNTEIKDTEEKEKSLQQSINEKLGGRFIYNRYQVKQLEKEIDPLKQELFTVQEKKKELSERKNTLENELKELQ